MEESWMHAAEFAAYVVAVVVGLDMIAERWFPRCKAKEEEEEELQEVLIVDNPEPSNDDDDGTVSANDDFHDPW